MVGIPEWWIEDLSVTLQCPPLMDLNLFEVNSAQGWDSK